ncbi:unnamed protein product [Heterobilharzia americana]|nr:unnamed protein product [Heterobilharzia americana]
MSDQESDDQIDDQPTVPDLESPQRKSYNSCQNYGNALVFGIFRKKRFEKDLKQVLNIGYSRYLTILSLIVYGLASMLDGGIYIFTGIVINKLTGPGAFIAFILAGFVALLNSLNYSELACRIPKDISCYTHTYTILGELPAFLIGWSMMLDNMLSMSVIIRSWTSILDILTGSAIKAWIIENIGRLSPPDGMLSEHPDFISGLLIIILCIASCFIPHQNLKLNAASSVLNVGIILAISVYMLCYAKVEYLYITSADDAKYIQMQNSNILPYGILGLISGTAVCFNVFIRSHGVSARAQEAKKPTYSLPIANIITVFIVGLIAIIASLALAMYYPWFWISNEGSFLTALRENTYDGGSKYTRIAMFYFFGIASLIGLITSLLSPMVSGLKICHAMTRDGLFPSIFSTTYKPFKIPIFTAAIFALVTGVFSIIFSIDSLADFLSLGTLIAYSVNSVSIICVRYRHQADNPQLTNKSHQTNEGGDEVDLVTTQMKYYRKRVGMPGFIKYRYGYHLSDKVLKCINSGVPGDMIVFTMAVYIVVSGAFAMCSTYGQNSEVAMSPWRLIFTMLLIVILILCIMWIAVFEQYGPPDEDLYRDGIVRPLLAHLWMLRYCLNIYYNNLLGYG